MRGNADRQPLCFSGTDGQRFLRYARHRLIGAGNHNLRVGIEVSDVGLSRDQQRLHPIPRQPHNRGQAVTVRIGLFH